MRALIATAWMLVVCAGCVQNSNSEQITTVIDKYNQLISQGIGNYQYYYLKECECASDATTFNGAGDTLLLVRVTVKNQHVTSVVNGETNEPLTIAHIQTFNIKQIFTNTLIALGGGGKVSIKWHPNGAPKKIFVDPTPTQGDEYTIHVSPLIFK